MSTAQISPIEIVPRMMLQSIEIPKGRILGVSTIPSALDYFPPQIFLHVLHVADAPARTVVIMMVAGYQQFDQAELFDYIGVARSGVTDWHVFWKRDLVEKMTEGMMLGRPFG